MTKASKSSGAIVHPDLPAGAIYRVIGADGVERTMSDLSDWIVAIRSGAVEPRSLFLDEETQRWRPVSDLDFFGEAKQATEVSEVRYRSNGSKAESAPEKLPKRKLNSTLVWAVGATVALIAFTAWAAGSVLVADVQSLIRRIPDPVRIGGAAVLFVILAEEFYWFSLMMFGVETGFVRRFALQALSLATASVLLYAAFALFSSEAFEPSRWFLVKYPAFAGAAYAVSLLLWSMILLRGPDAPAAKKALAGLVASIMLVGTLYMAVTPSVRQETQTDKTIQLQDRR
ncbi:hypothetical protein [Bradyrhizobium sp. WSM1743]|uniref:hypothetical protein n=1 Tax=Bradyrhizobium sp. WSM1743 TaxID=318996 RepID=UPI0004884166|nr:hypothetical protein [Bradyrhizobium sp. WSM1743]